jgi:hypothetical protein
VLTVIETIIIIMGRFLCSSNGHCDNNGEVYVQC